MKKYLLITLLAAFPHGVYAMGDIERGILYYSNSASFATLLPDMEGEIAKIKLEYIKKGAEFKVQVEANRQVMLKQSITKRIADLEVMKAYLEKKATELEQKKSDMEKWATSVNAVYRGTITKESLAKEIRIRSKSNPEIYKEWVDLLQKANANSPENINSKDFELVLFAVIDLQSTLKAIGEDISFQREEVEIDIKNLQTYLGDLK